ncbi:MAG: hypothetical protein HZC40_02150 [Chloroflexi bacterium]|nr:hypothetical protein [Chloroflexota bacterium]
MNKPTRRINLYLLNFALLFTHEIDSAFWKEWELFGIPGEIQVFLVLNFLLLLVALYGFKQVILGAPRAFAFSILLAASGVFAFCIHAYFIATGHPQFTLPVSMAILVLTLIVSIAQGIFAFIELWR